MANLTEHDGGRTFNVIHRELAGRNYFLRYLVADTCEYADIPQHRTRTYLVAFRDEKQCRRFTFPDKKPLTRQITDVIDTAQKAEESFYLHPGDYGYDKMVAAIRDDKQLYRFSDYGIQSSKDGIAFTLKPIWGRTRTAFPYSKTSLAFAASHRWNAWLCKASLQTLHSLQPFYCVNSTNRRAIRCVKISILSLHQKSKT